MAHSREKVRKSASARDSHARRICLKFPRETRGPPRRRSRVAREQAADRESFVRRARAVHVAATRLEPPPSFPPPRSLKCQIIGRTYVRSFCAPVPTCFFPPIHRLLFLNRERLDRFLLSPPPLPPPDGRVSHRLLNETERGYPLMRSFLIRLPVKCVVSRCV